MLRTIFMVLVFVPINFALGYLIAVRLGLAPPTLQDAITEVRDIAERVRRWTKPFADRSRHKLANFRERLAPIVEREKSRMTGLLGRASTLKDRFLPNKKKKPPADIGAKDLVVEPTLAEAVARAVTTPIFEQIADKIRFSATASNAQGGGKWDDGGGKGGSFMLKKRRLEQLRTGQNLVEMDKRIRSLHTNPDTEEFTRLLTEFQEDGKQIESLMASLIREAKARAPYAGGKLNETVTRLDALNAEATPLLTHLLAEVAKIEAATKPAETETPPADSEGEPQPPPSIPAETIAHSLKTLSPLFETLVRLRHRIRDVQSEINTLYARLDTNFEELKPEELVNANFNLSNRLGIESTLAEWWRTGVPATGRMGFALFDISGTQRLNDELSLAVVDRAIRALGRELRSTFPQPTTLIGLFSGNMFCLATRHLSLDELRIKLQKWQTRIESTPILWSRDDVSGELKPVFTISLVGVSAKLSESDVYARAERGLTAAKAATRGAFFVTAADATDAVAVPAPPATTNPTAATPFALSSLEMWEEIDTMTAKLAINSQDTSLLIHRAVMALRVGRPDLAKNDFDQAIETEPDKIVHYINRGLFRRWRKEYITAINDFDEVFTRQEVHATALKHRAIAYGLQGDTAAANADYKALLALVPAAKS